MPSSKNDPVNLRAFAKINLSLKVTGKRPDGFHDIDSIMQSVSLHDEVSVKGSASGIKVICDQAIENNIAEKAARTLLDEIKLVKGVEIRINKRIPLAAGLAGGSADAAAVLIGMNIALGLNLHMNKLIKIGEKIGSDVPFCLMGGTCRLTGRGEIVERVNPQSGGSFILVFPKLQVLTKDVYDAYDKVGPGTGGNELEKAAMSVAPEIKGIMDHIELGTGLKWKMSGSGPTLFLEMSDLSEADRYLDVLSSSGADHKVVKRMDTGVEVIY